MAFISYETSQNMLQLLQTGPLRTEKIFLGDALGRILAEDIVAAENSPAFPTAAMDGYAVVHSDLPNGRIAIIGENPAGHDETRRVEEGLCIKTFTGAVMPEGADTLIQIENVTVEDEMIVINESVPYGASVRPVAESYAKGDVLIKKGTKISFAETGVLAGLNRVMVPVALRPKVAVVATGSEILDLGEESSNPSQIRSSNNYTIAAIAQMAGAEVLQLGTIKDDKASITQGFENAFATADIIISTGGVSVGDYDFVKDIIPRLGAEVIYKGVKIKPGQHIMVAQRNGQFILALPGFAYSSTVTAILYAVPLIQRMLGRDEGLNIIEATLKEPFAKRSKKSEFTACNITVEDGCFMVDFEGKKVGSSAILNNMLGETALMITGEEDGNLEAGMAVNVILLDSF
ncbi:MAG: molybdopterin molybdotransferase MoeA [Campylobacterota bacterium]|nr:molybdopterin molybdotransferase MoeA [Campylobacterota bacterium]